MNDAIGRTCRFDDPLDPARAKAFFATLDLDGPTPDAGTPLPPFWQYIYFWDALPADRLGRDGHPKTGDFIPDLGLPRRMWAGGALEFIEPLYLGTPAQKLTEIVGVSQKIGRTGPLAVVTLQHRLEQNGRLCIRERQDLIYREDPVEAAYKPTPAPMNETFVQTAKFTPTLLFRYSALTFNGHRIHYDRDYCRDVEGYPGLVVHGPLLAQMLIHMAISKLGALSKFSFRAVSPLFDFECAALCVCETEQGLSLWVRGPDGRACMTAEATRLPV